MHELGLCQGIAEAVCRRARGRPVAWARVRLGGHPVDPEVVRQGVAMAAAGTEADGMDLELVLDPLRVHCSGCGAEEAVGDALAMAACPRCGGIDVDLVGVDEARLEAVGYRPGAGVAGAGVVGTGVVGTGVVGTGVRDAEATAADVTPAVATPAFALAAPLAAAHDQFRDRVQRRPRP